MFIPQKDIQNFNSQTYISPNIVFNVIQSLSTSSESNSSIRINYIINENNELLFSNNEEENKEKLMTVLFYEIFVIKIDFIKNKSKMIMIYNNENKEYKIKIWASKWEKVEIKNEYNKIIRNLCQKKSGNKVLKKLLQLKPEKYTIYYFPISISLFEKELAFIYILILTQKEKSKFQNFKHIKDLIFYSKSFLIPKINDLLYKYNKNSNLYNTNLLVKTINNDNKENFRNNHNKRYFNYISPKNKEILINFNGEILKKIAKKKNASKKDCKPVNFLRKPYNKIIFNYSFEKNDNNIHNNSCNSNFNTNSTTIPKIKSYNDISNEKTNQINTIIINTNRSHKCYNYIKIPVKINRLNDKTMKINKSLQNLPFSIFNMNHNIDTIPYSKKRPGSIPKRIMHYLSTNNYSLQRKKNNYDKDNELANSISKLNINQLSCENRQEKILYKRKSFSHKKNQQSIDLNSNYVLNKLNGLNTCDKYSTLDNIESYFVSGNNTNINKSTNKNSNKFDKENTICINLNKGRRKNNLICNGSMSSFNPLAKTYHFKKMKNFNNKIEDNNNTKFNKIPIDKKSALKIYFRNFKLKDDKNNIQLNNNGNKTSRNIMTKKNRRELLFKPKTCDKRKLDGSGNNQMKKLNGGDGEISLFI